MQRRELRLPLSEIGMFGCSFAMPHSSTVGARIHARYPILPKFELTTCSYRDKQPQDVIEAIFHCKNKTRGSK